MPSITTTTSMLFTNVGPLTTTYTAPSSCFTKATAGLELGFSGNPAAWGFSDRCYPTDETRTTTPWTSASCVPDGEGYAQAFTQGIKTSAAVFPYYSPGLACPHSWATVGVAERDETGNVTRSGVFANPSASILSLYNAGGTGLGLTTTATSLDLSPSEMAFYDAAPNELVNLLDSGETAIACCPSDYEMDHFGNCCSTMPLSSYTKSTACRTQTWTAIDDDDIISTSTRTFNYYGTTITAPVEVWPTGPPATTSVSITALSMNDTDRATLEQNGIIAVQFERMLTLVHHASDAAANTGSDADAGGAQPTETDNAGAGPVGGRKGTWAAVATILGIWGVVMGAGACLVVPL